MKGLTAAGALVSMTIAFMAGAASGATPLGSLPVPGDLNPDPVTIVPKEKPERISFRAAFGLDEILGEIILYNGYEADQGLPRPEVKLEILEMKFE